MGRVKWDAARPARECAVGARCRQSPREERPGRRPAAPLPRPHAVPASGRARPPAGTWPGFVLRAALGFHRPRARSAPARRALAGDCRSAESSGHLSPREPAPGPQLIGHPTGALLRHKSCNPVSDIKLLPCKEDRRQDLKEPKFVFVFVTMGFGSTVYRCNFCFLGAFFLIKKLASCVLQ